MINTIGDFLRYFDAVNRRALRDIGALPVEADGWAPAIGDGEKSWSINTWSGIGWSGCTLSAYRGEG
jgi:hypothetical protein